MGEVGRGGCAARPVDMAAISALGLLAYISVILHGSFLGEDLGTVFINSTGGFWDLVHIREGGRFIRPAENLLWRAEYFLFGLDPSGYHSVSVILNCVNACLLYLFAGEFLADRARAFVAGALFAVHPLHAEVSWLAAVNGVLCATFFLGAMVSFGYYARTKRGSGYALTLLLFVAALLSKEEAVVLPMTLLMLDFYWRRKAGLAARLRTHLPYFGVLAAYMKFRLYRLGGLGGQRTAGGESMHVTGVLDAVGSFVTHVGHELLAPVNVIAFPNYDLPVFLVSVAVLISLLVAAGRAPREELRPAAYALGLIAVASLPFLGVFGMEPDMLSMRYYYMLSAGFCLVLASLCGVAFRGCRRGFASASAALVVFYGAMLFANNSVWVDASMKAEAVTAELEAAARAVDRDLVVFFEEPPRNYKGVRFMAWTSFGLSVHLSDAGRSVQVIAVKDIPLQRAAELCRGEASRGAVEFLRTTRREKALPLYEKAVAISDGADDSGSLGVGLAIVRWDEAAEKLVMVCESS